MRGATASRAPAKLDRGETRLLVLLLHLGAETGDLRAALAGGRELGGSARFQQALRALEADLATGEGLSASLERRVDPRVLAAVQAGEGRGDLLAGLARAGEGLERGRLLRHGVLRRALLPVITAGFALLATLVAVEAALPSLADLAREAAALGERVPAERLVLAAEELSLLLSLPAVLGGAGFLGVVLLAAAGLARTVPAVARLRLRLPLVGALTARRAAADFAATFADHLAAGTGPEVACRLAAETVRDPWIRCRLHAAADATAAGEPFRETLAGAGLPAGVAASFAPRVRSADNGVRTAREIAEWAERELQGLAQRAGRLLAGLAYGVTAVLAVLLLLVLYLPLVGWQAW